MKKCSIWLIIKKTQTTSIMGCYHLLEWLKWKRLTITHTKCLQGWEGLNSHTLTGMENSKSFLKSLAVFSKLNTHSPYDPAIPHLGIYPTEMKHVHCGKCWKRWE